VEEHPTRTAQSRQFKFPVIGGLLVALAAVVGVVLSALLSWSDSVCNEAASVVRVMQRDLRISLLLVWLLVAAVPVVCVVVAVKRRRRVWPWAALACLFAIVALYLAVSAQPSTWCLY
jgi:uncharacterized BrkB/YihY/UPF0761 family membrane protein